jgi:CheY-like chemotaxis protein
MVDAVCPSDRLSFLRRNIMTAIRKVLVVDDDPVVGKSFHRVLSEDKGYVVITAHNAAEALERMREQEVDLVVTDIKMPGMDGVELAEEVRARRPWTPVVIITGYGSVANEQRAHAAGVSAFVRKPLSPEMIEEAAVFARQAPDAPVQPVSAHIVTPAEDAVVAAAPEHRVRNIALFLAAPFIGLAYALALPAVGAAMLVWEGSKALKQSAAARAAIRTVAMLAVAPFIGLAFALLLPLVGLVVLAWTAAPALWDSFSARGAARVAGFALSPLLGLAYFLFLPIAGTLTLAWVAMHSPKEVTLLK